MTNFARVIAFAGGILACTSTASANGIIHVNNTCDFKADVRAFEEGDVVNAVPRSSKIGYEAWSMGLVDRFEIKHEVQNFGNQEKTHYP